MTPLTTLTSRTITLPEPNIDTDQIIPARFLTMTTRDGLGAHAFHDWRYTKDGSETDHFLNTSDAQSRSVIVAGHNFGCGSSREHAPWALAEYGIRAVISSEIADIFRTNALKNGVLPLVVDPRAHQWLLEHPGEEVTVDLEHRELRIGGNGGTWSFEVDDFSRHCLMQGVDEMGYLASNTDAIAAFEASRGG